MGRCVRADFVSLQTALLLDELHAATRSPLEAVAPVERLPEHREPCPAGAAVARLLDEDGDPQCAVCGSTEELECGRTGHLLCSRCAAEVGEPR